MMKTMNERTQIPIVRMKFVSFLTFFLVLNINVKQNLPLQNMEKVVGTQVPLISVQETYPIFDIPSPF